MKRCLVVLMLLLCACDPKPQPPQIVAMKVYEYPVTPATWYYFERSLNAWKPNAAPGGGIVVDLPHISQIDPNASGREPNPTGEYNVWVDYLQHIIPANSGFIQDPKAKRQPIIGTHLVYEIEIKVSPGAHVNYMSDPDNLTGPPPPYVSAMISQGTGLPPNDFAFETWRWWNTATRLEFKNTNGVAKLDVALDPSQWIDVYGHRATESPEYLAAFRQTVAQPIGINLTLGGGNFYGHGLNVTGGTASIRIVRVYSY